MKLSQVPVKILLALIWMVLATESVRSQSANMSDISLPNPESMINEPDTPGDTPTGEVDPDVTPDEPVAEEVDPDTTPDEPVAEEIDPDTTPDEPVAEEVDPDTTPDEPVAEEVDPDTTPDEPIAEEVDPDVTPDEPIAEEVDPDTTPDEPVAEEVDPDTTPDEPVAEEVDPDTTPDEPIAEEVDPDVTPDEPIVEEVDPDTTPDEPVVGETDPDVDPDVTTDEPVVGETDLDVTTDEPVVGETDPDVDPDVTTDEPVVGEVDPDVDVEIDPDVAPDEPVVGEAEPEVDPDVDVEIDPDVAPDEPVVGEVDPEVDPDVDVEIDPDVAPDEPVVGEVDPEVDPDVDVEVDPDVAPDEPVVGEAEPDTNEIDTADNLNTAGDVIEETLGVMDEVPAGNSDGVTQNVRQKPGRRNNSATAFEDNSSSDAIKEGEIETIDNTNSEPTTAESEIVESEPSNLDLEETPIEANGEVQEQTAVIEEAAEPNKIVEELIEEAEIREIKNAEVAQEEASQEITQEETVNEVQEEVVQEETVEVEVEVAKEETVSEVEEEVAQEETVSEVEEEVAQEETVSEVEEEVAQEETVSEVEEEVAQEETVSEVEEEVAQEETEDEVTEEEITEEEEEVAEEQSSEAEVGQLDRVAYETQFQEAPNDLAILMQEEFQLTQLMDSSGIELYGSVPSVTEISRRLAQLAEQTGQKPAFINISLQSNQLESFVVMPEQVTANADGSLVASSELNGVDAPSSNSMPIRKTIKDTSRKDLIATATEFREEISDIRKLSQSDYKKSAQELYDVIIRPIEAELEANDIDVLVFSMDSGLRLLPVAALHDGEQFLIEKYAMGMVPSFGLTDTRYVSPNEGSILAMGASEFEDQAALPTMPIELQTIVSNPRRGESFLNEQFTIPNFVAQNSREAPFSIIHLGTHAEFKAGDLGDSYIQFYDDKLKIPQLQQLSEDLGWNSSDATPIELLVLSACETALGNKEAELGFAGLAVQAGVKSALASLWYVSDLGTLALMGEFYDQLGTTLVKAEALRQTQLEMLNGNVNINDRQVRLSNGADLALPEDFPEGSLTLDHPYFWSAFTLIGNWN